MNNLFVFVVTVGLSIATIKEAVIPDEDKLPHTERKTYSSFVEHYAIVSSVSASSARR